MIKRHDLNPRQRNFQSRQSCDTYVGWLAEEIARVDFGDIARRFLRSLDVCERYLLFQDS